MLYGTADIGELLGHAPLVTLQTAEPLFLGKVDWFQATFELSGDRTALFPSGLHPTTPVLVTMQVWQGHGDGDVGKFAMAQVRLSCRAGMRIRAFLLNSVIEGDAARTALSTYWGYAPVEGAVSLEKRADLTRARVDAGGNVVLDVKLVKPEPLAPADLQHIVSMNVGQTDAGPTLIQVEPTITTFTVQRGVAELVTFDPAFWKMGDCRLGAPVIAAFADAEITMEPARYTQIPEIEAGKGTVKI